MENLHGKGAPLTSPHLFVPVMTAQHSITVTFAAQK
jgi:hypothetical protein